MPGNPIAVLNYEDFPCLQSLVCSFVQPCGLPAIFALTRLDGRIYLRHTDVEKRRRQALIDVPIGRLEDNNLASRIYGVA